MKIALLADVHSNLEALTACLAHARREGVDRHAFLGDLLGYNADPVACLDIVRDLSGRGAVAVLGNHDQACLGGLLEEINFPARDAIYWTRERLDPACREFLAALPLLASEAGMSFAHASAAEPARWQYITSGHDAARALAASDARHIFVGHVHHAALYFTGTGHAPTRFSPVPGVPIPLSPRRRWLFIVGAVGQPRDGSAAACYAIFDQRRATLTSFRVPYDHHAAARKVRAAGLPERLARRLESGH